MSWKKNVKPESKIDDSWFLVMIFVVYQQSTPNFLHTTCMYVSSCLGHLDYVPVNRRNKMYQLKEKEVLPKRPKEKNTLCIFIKNAMSKEITNYQEFQVTRY